MCFTFGSGSMSPVADAQMVRRNKRKTPDVSWETASSSGGNEKLMRGEKSLLTTPQVDFVTKVSGARGAQKGGLGAFPRQFPRSGHVSGRRISYSGASARIANQVSRQLPWTPERE